jgi:triosephosphate isomerase
LKLNNEIKFIYGGSVNEKNAYYYLISNDIDGILPGGASLDPERFYKIITCVK